MGCFAGRLPRAGRVATVGVVLFAVAGCVMPRTTSPTVSMPVGKSRFIDFRTASKEVDEARGMIERGDYTVVIPRLLHVISKYPNSKAAVEARFWLGIAYHHIRSYREAIEVLEEYLDLSPEGEYARKAGELVAALTEEYQRKYLTPEELEVRLLEVQQALQTQPGDLALQMEHADLLWKRGNYTESGAAYAALIAQHPEVADDIEVAERIEVHPDGTYTVLSPEEVLRREAEANPLAVVNTASFKSGPDLLTRLPRHYVVTGQVVNRSAHVVSGVQVFVTIYGFGNVVFDTRTVPIGRMRPGERRAFSVQFDNFENIENVARYDFDVTFDR